MKRQRFRLGAETGRMLPSCFDHKMVTPAKLPEDEWKFDELPHDQIRGVFFYEFFRHSPKLQNLVIDCRGMETPKMVGDWPKGYSPLSREGRDLLERELKRGEVFHYLVEALTNCPEFPVKPALQLTDKDWLRQLMRSKAETVRLCDGIIDPDLDLKRIIEQARGKPGIDYRFKGIRQTKDYESVFPLVIDWRWPDAEIVKQIRAKVLTFRPDKFAGQAKGPPALRAFGNRCDNLPFKPSSALVWLGVLRRRETVGTWRKYFECYHDGKYERGAERAPEADCRKARLILYYLENGKPFPPEAFK